MNRKAKKHAWLYEFFTLPSEVPVFPLPETPLFPGIEMPLYIFEPRYRQMLKDAYAGHKFLAVALLRSEKEQAGDEALCHEIAGLGYLKAVYDNPDGTAYIVLKGIRRIRILGYTQQEPYKIAKICSLPDEIEKAAELHQLARKLKELLTLKLRFCSENPADRLVLPREFNNPLLLSHAASYLVDAGHDLKQDLLETLNSKCRLRHLIDLLEEELCPPGSQN